MPMQAQRGGRGIAPNHPQPGTSITLQALYPGYRTGTPCTGGWLGIAVVLDGAEIRTPTGIWSLDHQTGNKPQYLLQHPGCHCNTGSFSVTMGTPKEEIIWVGVYLGFMVLELTHLMLDAVFRNKHIVLIEQAKQWDQFYQSMHPERSELPLCSTDSWVSCLHSWTFPVLILPLKWNVALSLFHCKQTVQKRNPL